MTWLCNACDGSGEGMWDGSICSTCRGSGVDPNGDDENTDEEE
jgi:DnaJ-class molecular chaperone